MEEPTEELNFFSHVGHDGRGMGLSSVVVILMAEPVDVGVAVNLDVVSHLDNVDAVEHAKEALSF